ncbi:MAG TPA: hypothetical protein VLC10_00075 [Patescibacteria group bacterium]|nr:hypothetical protein [Patescibacteria group bacterium]
MAATVFVFGNPDVPGDSLPVRIAPALRLAFPDMLFVHKDPNEEWDVPEELTVIDAVADLAEPQVFDDLDRFSGGPLVSLHDFDAYANLMLLKKLKRLKRLRVIGLPPLMAEDAAVEAVSAALRTIP